MLFVSPLSGESVCLPGQPVHVVLGVQAPGEAAVRTAAHLDRQVADPLHHPAEEAVGGLGGDGIDPLRLDPGDAGQEKEISEASQSRHDDEYKKRSVSLSRDKVLSPRYSLLFDVHCTSQ